jgi:pyrimidine-nucleoside phosphorylase
MQAKEIITKKRRGEANSREELEFLLKGFLSGEVKEYQVSAWLMAVFFRGMREKELSDWTELMWRSGTTFPRDRDLKSHPPQYWIDKHSTGGVGDKTSLILVPLLKVVSEKYFPEISIRIPMVSGRGLGHTGGTLDKLESVPGFQTRLQIEKAQEVLEAQGFFMIGQTESVAPADRLIYSLRDVTGTIESIPLIVSSIMSKKLSENLDGILFDVKTGLGAFMSSVDEAKLLAQGLLSVAKSHGVDAVALITQMDEPLGYKTGNFLEVEECSDFLKGFPRDKNLEKLILESASWMLFLSSRKKISLKEGKKVCLEVIEKGEAHPLFVQMFESQGGDFKGFEKERESFRNKYLCFDFKAERAGWISQIHARILGVLLIDMGGGRTTKEAKIDNKVGFEVFKKTGDSVTLGETILKVYYKNPQDLEKIKSNLLEAVKIESDRIKNVAPVSIVREVLE